MKEGPMKRLIAAAAATALLAAPAAARDKHRRHHDRKDDGVASFLAGALIAGGLVALLSAKKAEAAPLPELTAAENEAANRCADAAERQMSGDGREARVERFSAVTPRLEGGWKIKGALRVADAGDGYAMRFSCTVKHDQVRSITVSI
jgi:hypothetical protein